MKLKVTADKNNAKVFDKTKREFIIAAQGAVKDAAAEAVKQGRQQIASAGFSSRWQRGLQNRFLKRRRDKPARLIFHRVGFMNVFERGTTIRGQPLLWVPIRENLPRKVRSPKAFGGKLVSVNVAGKRPLLFDASNRERGPLFVGIRQAKIRKRFALRALFQRIAARLPEFLRKRLEARRNRERETTSG